jgi:hypothetical protein
VVRIGPTLETELRRTLVTIARQLNRCRGEPVHDHEFSRMAEALNVVAIQVERVNEILLRLRLAPRPRAPTRRGVVGDPGRKSNEA